MGTIKKAVKFALLWPNNEVLCSQTLYQAMQAYLNLYGASSDIQYLDGAKHVAEKIAGIQNEDGGFDIGFNFVFGSGIMKASAHESTTPEILCTYALQKYRDDSSDTSFDSNIESAIGWIKKVAIRTAPDAMAMPYAPDTLKDPHILNATSFTLPVLAHWIDATGDSEAKSLYDQFCSFLIKNMEGEGEGEGDAGYFPYFYKAGLRAHFERQLDKIDNYHLGQQLKYHVIAQNYCENADNDLMIKRMAQYLIEIRDENGVYEYCAEHEQFPNNVHIWGYAAAPEALARASEYLGDSEMGEAGHRIYKWIVNNAWNGNYFFPVLDLDGEVLESEYYARTSGWVAAMTSYRYIKSKEPSARDITVSLLTGLEECQFKGVERNMWNRRLLYAVKVYHVLARRKQVL